jgi:hypothetical protein
MMENVLCELLVLLKHGLRVFGYVAVGYAIQNRKCQSEFCTKVAYEMLEMLDRELR